MIIDEKADIHFKEKLSRALKQTPIQIGRDVLTIVKSVFGADTELSLYVMNDEIIEKLGINIRRHITISGNIGFSAIEAQGYVITCMLQKNEISESTIPYLQLLDMLLLFKRAPETELKRIMIRYRLLMESLSHEEKKQLTRLARKYASCVRATLAFILCATGETKLYFKLAETLSPMIFKKYREKLHFLFDK